MQKFIIKIARFLAFIVFITMPLNAESKHKDSKMIIELKLQLQSGVATSQVKLEDNPATRDFYALLPLSLEFRDYVGKEKISPELPRQLNTQGLNGYNPQVGDLFYFSPWGNLGIFYAKQPFHSGLVRFGSVDSQILAKIKAQKDSFVITFERAK